MADLSKLILPNNSEYDLKDATARSGLANKQDTLVSGTNIKTINNESLLGSGNITIQGGGDSLPDQTGHNGDILSTDGTDPYWMDVSEATSVSIDTTVTASSSNLITSGAVATAISNIDALPSQSGNSGKFLTTNGSAASWANAPTELPTQTGNSGKYLTTNGTSVSWATVSAGDSLPSQSGHSGDFLTTNGTAASWADPVTTSTLTIDSTPTANSNNLVKSGGVYAMIGDVESVLTTLLEGTSS